MIRTLLLPATLTGVFRACFAFGMDYATDMLERGQVIGFSFVSGCLGSVFARLVLNRGKPK